MCRALQKCEGWWWWQLLIIINVIDYCHEEYYNLVVTTQANWPLGDCLSDRLLGDFPDGSVSKESTWNVRDTGEVVLIPGWGRYPRGKNVYPLQYSCLKNPMDGVAWQDAVWGLQRVGHDWATELTYKTFFIDSFFFLMAYIWYLIKE